jgi:hypothetical protein
MADLNHSLMIIVRPDGRREVVTRPGHIDVRAAVDLAARAGAKLHVMRHLRSLPTPGKHELVRIIEGERV